MKTKAFPSKFVLKTPEGYEGGELFNEGMDLRDYFAGQVLAGMMSHETRGSKNAMAELAKEKGISVSDLYAEIAYNIADAMIKERES